MDYRTSITMTALSIFDQAPSKIGPLNGFPPFLGPFWAPRDLIEVHPSSHSVTALIDGIQGRDWGVARKHLWTKSTVEVNRTKVQMIWPSEMRARLADLRTHHFIAKRRKHD
jgi:hypothetical protein